MSREQPTQSVLVHRPTIIIDKVVRSRIPATLTVRVQQEWRLQYNVSVAAIFEAVKNAQFCTAGTQTEKLCWKCNKANGKVAQVIQLDDKPTLEQFRERYSFQVKATCTSSRDHLSCELSAVVTFPNCPDAIVSPAFNIRSRQPSKKAGSKRPRSPRDIQISPTIVNSSESIFNTSPLTPSTPIKTPPECSPLLPTQSWNNTLPPLSKLASQERPIVVRLLLIQLPRAATEAVFRTVMKDLDYDEMGIVNITLHCLDSGLTSIASQGVELPNERSNYTCVVMATTYKSVNFWGVGRSKMLELLTNKLPNTLETDLLATGIVQFLAVFTSW
ncbi:hypothetical protein Pelo_2827 [Pelomyxa schiedti]|nr:hypothetical protein Pelo_2827 [Pelomyxa schiedti]